MIRADQCECGSDSSKVVETRKLPSGLCRHRKCDRCGTRWVTWETRENVFRKLDSTIQSLSEIERTIDQQRCG